MMNYAGIKDLREGVLALPELLTQVEAHFAEREDLGEEVDPFPLQALREHAGIGCRMSLK